MTTIIKNWHLVEVYESETINENSVMLMNIAWGIVVEDSKNRFSAGDFVCSSRIVELTGDGCMRTKSGTIYIGSGVGKVSRLHIEDLKKLRQGFSPDEILIAKLLGGELTDYTHC
jgi:hypothetical protein